MTLLPYQLDIIAALTDPDVVGITARMPRDRRAWWHPEGVAARPSVEVRPLAAPTAGARGWALGPSRPRPYAGA